MSTLARVTLSRRADVSVAALEGEVDMSNVDDVRERILAGLPNTALGLVLDLCATTYLDSSGVRLIFELAERLRGRQQQLRLAVPERSLPRRTLSLTGVEQAVPMHETVEEAIEPLLSTPGREADDTPRP